MSHERRGHYPDPRGQRCPCTLGVAPIPRVVARHRAHRRALLLRRRPEAHARAPVHRRRLCLGMDDPRPRHRAFSRSPALGRQPPRPRGHGQRGLLAHVPHQPAGLQPQRLPRAGAAHQAARSSPSARRGPDARPLDVRRHRLGPHQQQLSPGPGAHRLHPPRHRRGRLVSGLRGPPIPRQRPPGDTARDRRLGPCRTSVAGRAHDLHAGCGGRLGPDRVRRHTPHHRLPSPWRLGPGLRTPANRLPTRHRTRQCRLTLRLRRRRDGHLRR